MDPGMTSYTEDPLAAALRKLTSWQPVPTVQQRPDGPRVVVVEHAPLLQQLEVAAAGAMGSHAGTVAAGLDSTRLPGNWAAIQLRDEIRRRMEAWGCDPDDLAQYVWRQKRGWTRGRVADHTWTQLHTRVRSWADRIEALFDPPVTVPLESLCPRCGARWGEEPAHGDRIDAVAVLYQRDGDDVQKVRAECRNPECRAVWDGREGVRAMLDASHVRERYGVDPYALTDDDWARIAAEGLETTRV